MHTADGILDNILSKKKILIGEYHIGSALRGTELRKLLGFAYQEHLDEGNVVLIHKHINDFFDAVTKVIGIYRVPVMVSTGNYSMQMSSYILVAIAIFLEYQEHWAVDKDKKIRLYSKDLIEAITKDIGAPFMEVMFNTILASPSIAKSVLGAVEATINKHEK